MSTLNLKYNYHYTEYLDAWERQYSDATDGIATGYVFGKPREYPVHRLSEAEFERHLIALDALYQQIDAAQSYAQGTRLFASAFPHEIALLV